LKLLSRSYDIRSVLWFASSTGWVKCNITGLPSALWLLLLVGVYSGTKEINYGIFFTIPWVQVALYAEIMGAILGIENAFTKGWFRLWLECDSQLVLF